LTERGTPGPLLRVRNLSVAVRRGGRLVPVINDCGFAVNPGETVALVGESGCGKTITSLSISRLLPPSAEITNGEILFRRSAGYGGGGDVNLCSIGESELCRIRGKEIATIFQEPRQSLNPLMKVGKQIAEARELHFGDSGSDAREKALDILRRLDFREPEKTLAAWPHQLSGGMCQRVMIAVAAICRPALLVADEPTSSLDGKNRDGIISLLAGINREFGTAILFISHDLSLARRFCGRTLVMRKGTIVEEGPSETVFSNPAHPYTASLVGAVPKHNPRRFGTTANTAKSVPFLEVRDLSNAYENRGFGPFGTRKPKPVLKNVNLEIYKGEIFGLSGESGGGKSTLARCILGLIPYRGEVLIDGKPAHPPRGGREEIAGFAQMIFQEPGGSLNPARKIGPLLEEPLVIRRVGTARERIRMVDEMLELVGLESAHKGRRAGELSGGQKQRACIARALMAKPGLLVADEATSSLDVFSGAQILGLFRDLRQSLGLTVLFISHDTAATEFLCDRTAVMREGSIVRAPWDARKPA